MSIKNSNKETAFGPHAKNYWDGYSMVSPTVCNCPRKKSQKSKPNSKHSSATNTYILVNLRNLMANSCTPPLAYPMAEVFSPRSSPPLQQNQTTPTTKIEKQHWIRSPAKPYWTGSHSSQWLLNIPHHAATSLQPQPTLAAIATHQNMVREASGSALTLNCPQPFGGSSSHLKFKPKLFHQKIQKEQSPIWIWKWWDSCCNGLCWNILPISHINMLHAGATTPQPLCGHQNSLQPWQQEQHTYYAFWPCIWFNARPPHSLPSMYWEKWISWLTLHPDHFTHIRKHDLFSLNFKTISCYHRKLPRLHASCQTSYLEESFQLC